jgi:CRISPR-associated protein Csm2
MEQIIKKGHDLRTKIQNLDKEISDFQVKKDWDKSKEKSKDREREIKRYLDEFKDSNVTSWISDGLNDESPILFAEFLGHYLVAKNLSTSQIRNVFGEVKRMEMSSQSGMLPYGQFLLLKPRLTYATERKGTDGSRAFKQWMIPAIDAVISGKTDTEKKERFDNFSNFFEAILAYHRAFGGK